MPKRKIKLGDPRDLKIDTRTVGFIRYKDFDRFVAAIYGIQDYEFIQVQECGNDSYFCFTPTGEVGKWEEEDAKKITEGEEVPVYRNSLLFELLVRDGHLKPGEYMIDVCW